MKPSKVKSWNIRDTLNTLIFAALATLVALLSSWAEKGSIQFNWHLVYVAAISAGIPVAFKNFFTHATCVDVFKVDWKDLIKGLALAIGSAVVATIQTSIDAEHLKINWPLVISVALGAAVAYLKQKLGVELKPTSE